ncbi:unnamed protein product, partial [Gulo gulo]
AAAPAAADRGGALRRVPALATRGPLGLRLRRQKPFTEAGRGPEIPFSINILVPRERSLGTPGGRPRTGGAEAFAEATRILMDCPIDFHVSPSGACIPAPQFDSGN